MQIGNHFVIIAGEDGGREEKWEIEKCTKVERSLTEKMTQNYK